MPVNFGKKMPKLAFMIACVSTDSRIRPGTMKLPKSIPAMSLMRLPMADPNTRK